VQAGEGSSCRACALFTMGGKSTDEQLANKKPWGETIPSVRDWLANEQNEELGVLKWPSRVARGGERGYGMIRGGGTAGGNGESGSLMSNTPPGVRRKKLWLMTGKGRIVRTVMC